MNEKVVCLNNLFIWIKNSDTIYNSVNGLNTNKYIKNTMSRTGISLALFNVYKMILRKFKSRYNL